MADDTVSILSHSELKTLKLALTDEYSDLFEDLTFARLDKKMTLRHQQDARIHAFRMAKLCRDFLQKTGGISEFETK